MGGKEHRRPGADTRRKTLPHRLQPFGKGLGKQGVVGPAIDEIDFDSARGFGKDGAAVESHTGAGVLWRKTNGHRGANAILTHLANNIRDVRPPVAHADIHREFQRLGEQAALLQGELRQRARADETVTVTDLFND